MISTTTIRERPQLLPHSHTDSSLYTRSKHHPTTSWPDKLKVTTLDISLLLKAKDEETSVSAESTQPSVKSTSTGSLTVVGSPSSHTQSSSPNIHTTTTYSTAPHPRQPLTTLNNHIAPYVSPSSIPAKRQCRGFDHHPTESPAKKQSKWSPEEDAKIIQLRGDGMKWEDISKHLPGRSAISCRLHYQNYLERRSEWDEDRKNKLARLYERFKADMWAKIAEEMAIPWRAAEAMHWQMGEQEMARRAGVTPFSLTTNLNQQSHIQNSNASMSQYTRGPGHVRSNSATPRLRRDSHSAASAYGITAPATIHGPPQLPSLAELTAGLPAYSNGNHQHHHSRPSPPMLTPPLHMYKQSAPGGYPFQSRFHGAAPAPPPTTVAAHAHGSRH